MVKYINTTGNDLLSFIKKERLKKKSIYTLRISLAKPTQLFLSYNQLNSFDGTQ